MRSTKELSRAHFRNILNCHRALRSLLQFHLLHSEEVKLVVATKTLARATAAEIAGDGLRGNDDYAPEDTTRNVKAWAYLFQNPRPPVELALGVLSARNYPFLPSNVSARLDNRELYLRARKLNTEKLRNALLNVSALEFTINLAENSVELRRHDVSLTLVCEFCGEPPEPLLAVRRLTVEGFGDQVLLAEVASFSTFLQLHFRGKGDAELAKWTAAHLPHFVVFLARHVLLGRWWAALGVAEGHEALLGLTAVSDGGEIEPKEVHFRVLPGFLQAKFLFALKFYDFQRFKAFEHLSAMQVLAETHGVDVTQAWLEPRFALFGLSRAGEGELARCGLLYLRSGDAAVGRKLRVDASVDRSATFARRLVAHCQRHLLLSLLAHIDSAESPAEAVVLLFERQRIDTSLLAEWLRPAVFAAPVRVGEEEAVLAVRTEGAMVAVWLDPQALFVRGVVLFRLKSFGPGGEPLKLSPLRQRVEHWTAEARFLL